ncbi:MAG: hypothetical protein H7338_01895 [Candidatus Sericytochromatia bacterium]|nr:hypothetical protein [Candidatus Sericytochromatia bacterium]
MRFWRRTLASAALCLMVSGCAHVWAYDAALDAERKGEPVIAATKTVDAVEQAHDYPEARAIWPQIWSAALADVLQRVNRSELATDWETAVGSLETLETIVKRAEKVRLDTPMSSQTARLHDDRDKAAAKLYAKGLAEEQTGRLREAATCFRRATTYVQGYRDASTRYAKTRSAAMVRVGILPFDNASYYRTAGEMLGDKLVEDLLTRQGEFLSFVDRQYLNNIVKEASLQASGLVDPTTAVRLGKLAGVRYLVVGRVSQVSATTPTDRREQYNANRVITDNNNLRYTVNATYTMWRQTREVLLSASVQIIDVTDGTVTKAWTETERTADTIESISNVIGDQRALDYNQQRLQYTTPILKSHDALLSEATVRLSQTLAQRVADQLN